MISSAKEFLKRSAVLRRINAAVKNAELDRRTRRVADDYQRRLDAAPPSSARHDVRAMLAARMAAAGVRALTASRQRPSIFLVGTEYEQERAGFIQGLSKCGDVIALTRADGSYGLRPSIGSFDRETIEENSRQLVRQVDAAVLRDRVDVLIGTMVAQYVSLEALQHVRRRGIPVVNIAMDDRLIDHWGTHGDTRLGAIGLTPGTDLVLQTTPEYVPRYLLEGCPAVFWPFGSDPELFGPRTPKRYDVGFVGNNYGWRSELIQTLLSAGIRVECFGRGFPNGHIGADTVPRILGESRIVLGVGTIAHSRRIVTLKLRDFDGPMSGSLYVTTENPDLQGLFRVGEEMVTYRSPSDCIRILRYYLDHEDERESIAAAGRRRAVADHTWERRITEALGLLGRAAAG